jgi:hypothetical protein
MPKINANMRSIFKRLYNSSPMAKSTGFLIVFFCVAYGSSAALSEVRDLGDESLSIKTRIHKAFEPSGFRLGDINIFPSLINALNYTDNVYASRIGAVEDFVRTVRPELNIRSDFIRHQINLNFSAERGLYKKITSENYTDYNASIDGRVDITGQTSAPFSLSFERGHIRRGSPDDRASLEPTVFDLWQASTGLVHQGQTLAMKAIAEIKQYFYDENITAAGRIDNSDRDRKELSLYTSIGMAEEAYLAPYVYSGLKSISYDKDIDRDGFSRNSSEYELGTGTIINLSDITRASFNVGYLNRHFSESRFANINAFTYGFNLSWEPSPLVLFLFKGDRAIREVITTDSSASIDSTISLTADYELFPNVSLSPTIGYQESEYEGIDKTITAYNGGIDTTYKMNQNLWLSLSYRYITQDDEGADSDGADEYKNNTYGFSLRLQF